MIIDLKGKNALVCGSSKGIGYAIACRFAELGATVTMMARNGTLLERVVRDLDTSAGQTHNILVADFTKPQQVREAIEKKLNDHYIYNILVNNNGGPSPGPIINAREEEFLEAMNAHLLSSHQLVQSTVDGMKQSGYGRIINIISTSVKIPLRDLGVSNTVRGAMANWSKTLANELAPWKITVNNILPGATSTDRLKQIISGKAVKKGSEESIVEKEMLQEVPMGRFASPDEIAYAACFLASAYASYITGINLPVDGGRTGSL